MYFAVVRTADNLVVGIQTGAQAPIDLETIRYIEITAAEHAAIAVATNLEQGGGPAWQFNGTGIVARPDTRKVAFVSLSAQIIAEGGSITVGIETQNADGSHFNFNGSRRIGLRKDGKIRRVKLDFAAGQYSRSVVLEESGDYELFTLEPSVYRVAGETAWSVEETWT